jgi:hypothetical protein
MIERSCIIVSMHALSIYFLVRDDVPGIAAD